MTNKVLVLDIDGTLTNSEKEIDENTRKGLLHIQERGHIVILASGRPTQGMMEYAKILELEKYGGYLLAFNGGRIINCRTGEIVFQKTLPAPVIPSLYRFAIDHDCGLMSYLGDQIITETRLDRYMQLESKINHMPIRHVDNFVEYAEYQLNKCLMTAEPDNAAHWVEELNRRCGDILSIYRSEPFFIEIMPKNVDKATSLDRMLATVGLTRENTICVGDGFNDMSMIRYAGVGVAMENAQPVVKDAADYVTKSNDDEGIVHVIDKFIMNE